MLTTIFLIYGGKFSYMQFEAHYIYCTTSFSTNKCINEFYLFIHVDLAFIVTLFITYMICLSLLTTNLSYFSYGNVYIDISLILSVLWGMSYAHLVLPSSRTGATPAPSPQATIGATLLSMLSTPLKFLASMGTLDALKR